MFMFIVITSETVTKIYDPIGLYMNVKPQNIKRIKSDVINITVGFPIFKMQTSAKSENALNVNKVYIENNVTTLLKKNKTINNTLYKFLPSLLFSVYKFATKSYSEKELIINTMSKFHASEFNNNNIEIKMKIEKICYKLNKEIKLNNIFNKNNNNNDFLDLQHYDNQITPYIGSKLIRFFSSNDIEDYFKKLCNVPEYRIEIVKHNVISNPDEASDHEETFIINLSKFGITNGSELFSNLTISIREHLKNLIKIVETAYKEDIIDRGINKIGGDDYSFITKHTIRRTYLLNLHEKFILYKLLIDHTIYEEEIFFDIFNHFKKQLKQKHDIISNDELNEFIQTINGQNKKILLNLEQTLSSEEYISETPLNTKETKQIEFLIEAEIQLSHRVNLINQNSLNQQWLILDNINKQRDIVLNATKEKTIYHNEFYKDRVFSYMTGILSHLEGITIPMYTTVGKILKTGSKGATDMLGGIGLAVGQGVGNVVFGVYNGLFGTWSWLMGIATLSILPTLFVGIISWKIGGIKMAFSLTKWVVYKTYVVITYIPRKIVYLICNQFPSAGANAIGANEIGANEIGANANAIGANAIGANANAIGQNNKIIKKRIKYRKL